MFLKDFAESRNVKPNTITAYIKSHDKEFHRHTRIKDGKKWLDDTAVALLEQKYPAPKPIQVIEDREARQKLMEAQQLIIQLQQQLVEAAPKIAWADQNQAMLEAVEEEKEALKEENKRLQNENDLVNRQVEKMVAELSAKDSLKYNWNNLIKHDDTAELLETYRHFVDGELSRLREQIDAEKNKTWWDKLRGR